MVRFINWKAKIDNPLYPLEPYNREKFLIPPIYDNLWVYKDFTVKLNV